MLGIIALQLIMYFLATKAEDHHIMTVVMVRILFFGIQLVMFLILDEKMHYFQFRTVCVVMVTAIYELCAGHVNPLYMVTLFYLLSCPYFSRREKELEKQIKQALEHDDHLFYYSKYVGEKPSKKVKSDDDQTTQEAQDKAD